MTWYMVSLGPEATHLGEVIAGSRILTNCGGVYPVTESLELALAPGEDPPDPDQICPRCAEETW